MKKNLKEFFRKPQSLWFGSVTYPCKQILKDDNFVCKVGTSFPASQSSNEGTYPASSETFLNIIDLDGKALRPLNLGRTVDGRTQVGITVEGDPEWLIRMLEFAVNTLKQQKRKSYLQRVHEYCKAEQPGADPCKIREAMKEVLTRWEGFKRIR